MAEKKVNDGEIIFTEGDVGDVAYVVSSGSVELTYMNSGVEVKAAVVEAGKAFGEFAIFSPQDLRQYTARAVGKVTLQTMTEKEFREQVAKCPEAIQPFLNLVFEKITPAKTRTKTVASSVAKGDIAKITITPASDTLKTQFKSMEVPVSALPFRIGGYPEGGEKNRKDQVHLALAAQKNPLLISRQHCEIALDEKDNVVINDLGSRFCTTVNGTMIGRGRGVYSAALKKGDNELYLGSGESTYKLGVKCA